MEEDGINLDYLMGGWDMIVGSSRRSSGSLYRKH